MSEEISKAKYLSRNLMLFTLSGIGTKLITFLLVPLYTNFLSTTEYGTIDLIGTIINLSVPILSLSLESVIDVFCLDKEYNCKEVISSSARIWLRAVLLNLIVALAIYLIVPIENKELFIFGYLIVFISQGTTAVMASIYRGLEKVEVNVITSLTYTITLCILNVLFLTLFDMGMLGYYLSVGISGIISITIGYLKIHFGKYIIKHPPQSIAKRMQAYGGPLIFNQIGWWINNSLDKYVVIYFLGMADNGIYSIAYKIPTILSVISGIFSSAWSLSAIKDFKSEDAPEFASRMYSIYNAFICITCAIVLILNVPLAKILYAKEFFTAWNISGILVVATVFNGLSTFVGAFFAAAKDSKSYASSTIIGGVINLLISIVLVNHIGYTGVAIGTLVSYGVIWIIRLYLSKKYIVFKIDWIKNIIMYLLLGISCVIGLKGFKVYVIVIQTVVLLILLLINRREIKTLSSYFYNTYLRRLFRNGKISN